MSGIIFRAERESLGILKRADESTRMLRRQVQAFTRKLQSAFARWAGYGGTAFACQ